MSDLRIENRMTELEARWKAEYETNMAILAGWAEEASGGVLTVRADPYEKRCHWGVSLVRVDGKPLGYYDRMGEREPISGFGTATQVPYGKLTRRHRKTLRAVHDAVQATFYSGRYDNESFGDLRADFDRKDIAVALTNFERRYHLTGIKP